MSPYPSWISKLKLLKEYREVPVSILFIIIWYGFHNSYISVFACGIAISLIAILVAEITEVVSEKVPQPFDSLLLTISAVWVEILLLFMILRTWFDIQTAEIAKNSIISAVLVDINILFWFSLFVWWLVWKQQVHNEDSSESYTLILLTTIFVILVPTMLKLNWSSESWVYLSSICISIILFLFYLIMLIFQTKTHVHFFKDIVKKPILWKKLTDFNSVGFFDYMPTWLNISFIFSLLLLVWFVAERFSHEWMLIVKDIWLPLWIAWIMVAFISVFPEFFTVIKAARANEVQKVVNISLWASVVTILLTIPALVLLSLYNGMKFDLSLNLLQLITLIFTVFLVWKSTKDWETDYLKWITHIILFISYVIMIIFM